MRRRTVAAQLAAILPLLTAAVAWPTDGVIEINQAKALAGGVTPGDTAGFPVTISAGGSFRLTSDLDVRVLGLPASANTDGIDITGSGDVTIDLNGFGILGPASCPSFPCANTGIGSGIVTSTLVENRTVAIRNGTVRGMGLVGINLNGTDRIADVSVFENGGIGIAMGRGVASRVVVSRNGGRGLDGYDAVIESSYLGGNSGDEIFLIFGTIDGCNINADGGLAVQLSTGLLSNTNIETSAAAAVTCLTQCALSGNRFSGCAGAGCLAGAGTRLQIPPASNMCGAVVCP